MVTIPTSAFAANGGSHSITIYGQFVDNGNQNAYQSAYVNGTLTFTAYAEDKNGTTVPNS